jgi:hypothetical protein
VTDADELRDLLQRYARAADDRDIDGLADVFEPGAVIEGTRGALDLDGWLETMRGPRAFPVSMHVLGEPVIDSRRVDECMLDTYAVVYQLGDRDAGQSDLTLGIRYLDEVVRIEGRWRIRHRRAQTLWMR